MKTKEIYNHLPVPLRSIPASLWGFYLRYWRYGNNTESLVEEILERDNWSAQKWQDFTANKLDHLLFRARNHVPYYRDYWNNRQKHGDHYSFKDLSNWPILTKSEILLNPIAFIADDVNPKSLYVDHTGGTTGTPLTLYESRAVIQNWYAIYEARVRRWHGVTYKNRWAILGGQTIIPIDQTKPPYWITNLGLNQLYLSTFHISKKNVDAYVNKINNYKPTHLVVYPSSILSLAQEILIRHLYVFSPKVIITNAEPITEIQREIISQAFNCPVIKTYGMGEIALGASECKNQNLHFWPESGIMEVVDENGKASTEKVTGSYLATGLVNDTMPLIRYDVGDRGKIYRFETCDCGRSLPILDDIEGRSADSILTPDGRRIFWLNPVFYDLPIMEAQIIQDSLESLRIIIVPTLTFTTADSRILINRIIERLGKEISVTLDFSERIPRGANGKFKPVISSINNDNHNNPHS